MLAGNVHAGSGRSNYPGHGRHIDDGTSAALPDHLQNFVLHAEPDAFEVDVLHLIPIFLGLLDERSSTSADLEASDLMK